MAYDDGTNFGSGIFELEEGLTRVKPETGDSSPTLKTQDRLRLDGLYIRFINDRWGPYARVGMLGTVFPSEVLATESAAVAYNDLDGTRRVLAIPANDTYRTADSFGATRVREGVGINYRLLRSNAATVNWRLGVGLRQNLYRGAYVLRDDGSTPELDYYEIDSFNEEGVETIITGTVRVLRNVLWITDLEIFADFGEMGDPTVDWRNTLSLRLTRAISLDYTLDVLDQPMVQDKTQVRQNFLVRFSFDLL